MSGLYEEKNQLIYSNHIVEHKVLPIWGNEEFND